jgi:hypothetical protein
MLSLKIIIGCITFLLQRIKMLTANNVSAETDLSVEIEVSAENNVSAETDLSVEINVSV